MIVKINKTKSWFFEKINKIDKPLAKLIKEKREKNQINKEMEKERLQQTMQKYKGLLRGYYEQLYGNKMDNLEEMDRFLEKFNLPRLNQEDIEIMNNPTSSTEIEAVIKNLPKNKSQMASQNSIKTFREELMPILLKLFQKIAEEGTLPNSFYKVIITLTPKPDKDNIKKKKLQANITNEHRCKNPQQNFSKQNSATYQKAHTP